jgi:hypothetical protein
MEDIRKADPTFTGFTPRTACEAVDRYVRCRRNGLKPLLVPECLIACAARLPPDQMELFENWIVNPNGSLENVELIPDDTIRKANEALFRETEARVTKALREEPPLPASPDTRERASPSGIPST